MMDKRVGKHGEFAPTETICGQPVLHDGNITRSNIGDGYYIIIDAFPPKDFDLKKAIKDVKRGLSATTHKAGDISGRERDPENDTPSNTTQTDELPVDHNDLG